MDNLPELRDIHVPDGVSAFPPAYGWWVVLAGVVALFLLAELFLILRRASKKLYARRLLQKHNFFFAGQCRGTDVRDSPSHLRLQISRGGGFERPCLA